MNARGSESDWRAIGENTMNFARFRGGNAVDRATAVLASAAGASAELPTAADDANTTGNTDADAETSGRDDCDGAAAMAPSGAANRIATTSPTTTSTTENEASNKENALPQVQRDILDADALLSVMEAVAHPLQKGVRDAFARIAEDEQRIAQLASIASAKAERLSYAQRGQASRRASSSSRAALATTNVKRGHHHHHSVDASATAATTAANDVDLPTTNNQN